MKEYQKINTIYKRDERSHFKNIIISEYSLPEFEYLANNKWLFTEKVDGTNIRIDWHGGDVTFGGRTDSAQIPANLYNVLQNLSLSEKLKFVFPTAEDLQAYSLTLYGEGFGKKIQGGEKYLGDSQGFVLFDVLIGDWWLERPNVEDIASKLGIPVVPIIGSGTLAEATELTRTGFKSTWGYFMAEGLVLRPEVDVYTRKGERVIAKIKHKDFSRL